MTISTEKVSRASQWTESTWSALVDHVADEFGLEKRGRSALRAKEIAKLIGAIPYLAGCDDPQDLAPANLRHYVASCGAFKKLYAATPENSAETLGRLAPLHYNGGDEAVIRRGMSLIALNMLADYKRDVELDRSLGKYNPIGAGDWDYDEKLCELLRNIDAVDCPDMDDIATVHTI
ncbi:MAG: hypothetical protein ACOCU9_02880, partial [Spirochaetota bacterium]